MRITFLLVVPIALFIIALGCAGEAPAPRAATPKSSVAATAASTPPRPVAVRDEPPTRRSETVEQLHGVDVSDPYRWLEDGSAAEVKAWLAEQGAHARKVLDALPERAELVRRFRELYYVERMQTPVKRGRRYFWEKKEQTSEKDALYYRDGEKGAPKVLLDPNTWSPDGSVSLGVWSPSHDGRYVAYGVKKNNSDEATLEIVEVTTGKRFENIPGAKYTWSVEWNPRGTGFYYVRVPPLGNGVTVADRPGLAAIRYHELGKDPEKDPVVREPTRDPTTFQSVNLSKNGRWLVATVQHGWVATDVYFRDTKEGPSAAWKTLVAGEKHLYFTHTYENRFFVFTDENAPNYRILELDPKKPERGNWKEIVPERKDAAIDVASVVGRRLAITYIKDVASTLEVFELDGKKAYDVALPAPGYASEVVGVEDEDEAYFTFESLVHPPEIHKLSMKAGKTDVVYRTSIPVDPSRFTTTQVFATSRDGTKIPMFVLAPKDLPLDGRAPTLLNGYGGFSVTLGPRFSTMAFPWLEHGGVYVVANLRGGGEYGETWHRAGMRGNKQNVFDDFIASAEFLIGKGYTKPERLVIHGRSNGGLLVGAAMTQRPDLFRVVLCGVPLLDMVRY
ncbi:MAG TPA: prolyl oligopeptidase family serine peptidase, partial [Polyangiaceae bacterium]|nr:prolyl oligopeptidase family serine peptidase [Polyangiaceae bacterium]